MENKLGITKEQLHKAKNDFIEKIKIYREVALDDTKGKADLKEAANTVIRAMAAYIDLQTESKNELIMIGQVLGEYITGDSEKASHKPN